LDIGAANLKKGEKRKIMGQPEYAYGKMGSKPKIPENATLIFEVELIKWEMEDLTPDKDGGVLRRIITAGTGFASPSEGASVEVHIVGRFNDNIFDERDVKYELGEYYEANIVEGIDVALQKFKMAEKSKLFLKPRYAFGAEGKVEFNVPANSSIVYEVTLTNFEKEKESWNMSAEEKLQQSEMVKNKGTKYFKEGKYEIAVKQYKKIINYLNYETELEGELKEKK